MTPSLSDFDKNTYVNKWVFIILIIFMAMFGREVRADIGLDWLLSQYQSDGSFSSLNDKATPYQSSSEALKIFTIFNTDNLDISTSREFLSNDLIQNTEYLSRQIISTDEVNQNTELLINQLLKHHSSLGGFGEFSGYDSSVIDTGYAIEAIALAGYFALSEIDMSLSFLLNEQNDDGGWSASRSSVKESSVFITAIVLKALSHYKGVYNLEEVLKEGADYLIANQGSDALWSEPFLTPLSIISLIHITNNSAIINESVSALRQQQQADGSWGQDVYTTALALRAINVAETPPVNPVLARIRGRLLDGMTGRPLVGVSISLNGPTVAQVITLESGDFELPDLIAGKYTLSIQVDGYNQITAETIGRAGQTVDFGDITLLADTHNSTTATIIGNVSDLISGVPLEGVHVVLSGSDNDSVVTDSNGAYQFINIGIGEIVLHVSKDGYSETIGKSTLTAGATLLFSPKLTMVDEAITAIQGVIREASTGEPLQNVLISVNGSTIAQTNTDTLGHYQILSVLPGMINIEASRNGYDSVNVMTEVYENSVVDFSPQLYSSDSTPLGANLSGVEGVVVDAVTNKPLSDVLVKLLLGSETREMLTSAEGTFDFEGIFSASAELSFVKQGYITPQFSVPLVPLDILDIGQVRIREEALLELLPDLIVSSIDLSLLRSDLNTLKQEGEVSVSISNQGSAKAIISELVVFHDANNDGVYSSDNDVFLGSTHMENQLSIKEEQKISIKMDGFLPYRDAPISAWVDSSQVQIESNELNNFFSTLSSCMLTSPETGELNPVEKWHWSGSNIQPSYNQVMSTPMVAQLSDDNGDGKIDSDDIPDIVFTTFSRGRYTGTGILRAISGADGTDIWGITPLSTGMISPAIGDIDNDGFVEIVVGGPARNGLRVYEHDGTLKWKVSVNGSAHPVIADLDNDGSPEIIYAQNIYNSEGSLITTLSQRDFTPIAVDLDMNGDLEVFANGNAYHHDGSTYWDSGYRGTFAAVGNFDEDKFPEIAMRTTGSVTLLNHDGSLIWGPVAIPGGGGGPLTISDVDGDGEPEIGVAGARNYTVFETDGSIKWVSPTRDFSSRATGSSVFDFESDGKSEILYNDELNFRIYDGETGKVLYQVRNTSGTLWEFPVVADIDNDNHAEIILASNNYAFGGKTGIRVFENQDDSWVATRSIHNQHTYHINNINDDGTIPQYEKPSWLEHNTYRLNTFSDRNPLGSSDLTASLLVFSKSGDGQQGLTVRIGNAGVAPVTSPVDIVFYEGHPADQGILLGKIYIAALAANEFSDIRLTGITLSSGANIFVTVDSEEKVTECNESNNSIQILTPNQTSLFLTTDKQLYTSDEEVTIPLTVVNTGPTASDTVIELLVRAAGATSPLSALTTVPVGVLEAGAEIHLESNWNTAATLRGDYEVYGRLVDTNGVVLDESQAPFKITLAGSVLNSTVTTDKTLYEAWDQVVLTGRVENVTRNAIQLPSFVEITVRDPSGSVVFTESAQLGELLPEAIRDLPFALTLVDAQSGVYAVEMVVKDALTHQTLNIASTSFQVERFAIQALTGQVEATPVQVHQGDPTQCTETVHNISTVALNDVVLISQLVSMDSGQIVNESQRTLIYDGGQSDINIQTILTDDLPIGAYACVLAAVVDGQTRRLDLAGFDVIEPPIRIEGSLSQGERGRVLILLDESPKRCEGYTKVAVEATLPTPLTVNATLTVTLYNEFGVMVDREVGQVDARALDLQSGNDDINLIIDDIAPTHIALSVNSLMELGKGYQLVVEAIDGNVTIMLDSGVIATNCTETLTVGDVYGDMRLSDIDYLSTTKDPLGTNHLPDLDSQRTVVETLLSDAGWSYTIVTSADNFAYELRTGGYVTYLLLSEQVKLDETVQKELREAVYRGEGLVEAGGHDQRQGRIDEALGVKFLGKHASMQGVNTLDNDVTAVGHLDFQLTDRTLKATSEGAIVLATFSQQDDITTEPAVTHFDYGQGHSLYVGFDLAAEAAMPNASSLFGDLLLDALSSVHPDSLSAMAQGGYPLRLTLDNLGIATPGQVVMTLPEGVSVIDVNDAAVNGQTVIWPFNLEEEEVWVRNAWLTLPDEPLTVTALIQSGVAPDWVEQGDLTLDISPSVLFTVEAAYLNASDITDNAYKQVQKYLGWAQQDSIDGQWADALSALLRASDALIAIGTEQSDSLHVDVAKAIRTVSTKL